jgi:hypothetical protein
MVALLSLLSSSTTASADLISLIKLWLTSLPLAVRQKRFGKKETTPEFLPATGNIGN